jgi:phage terminase large subunit-like protein
MSKVQIDGQRWGRWKARTDLGWLCRNVLGYPDVADINVQPGALGRDLAPCLPIHQPLISTVQAFPVPTPEQAIEHDQFINGRWHYKPLMPMTRLPGHRRTLILDARGFLKSTINTMAHTIQWILNYPDCAVMVVQSNGAKAEMFIFEIKKPFLSNPVFRNLFPEHVPQKINEFGTRTHFTTLARNPAVIRKEPTVLASSIDKGMAGIHVDVIKCSDIVDPSNINGQGLEDTKRSFGYLQPLLVAPSYWLDVEGTRYHSNDAYGKIIDEEMACRPEDRQYKMYIRSCYQRVTPDGRPQKFTIDELKYPFKLGPDGKPLSWWPERFTTAYYERMKSDDPFVFATQQLNDPSAAVGTKVFPVEKGKYPVYIDRVNYAQKIPVAYKEIIIDTAETVSKRADYTVLTVVAWDNTYGRMYVEEIRRGRFLQDQWIKILIELLRRHRPLKVKIEETGYVRGAFGSIMREVEKAKRIYNLPQLTFDLIKRENQQSKTERIQMSLQSPYTNKDIRFLTDLDRWCEVHNPLQLLEAKCNCITHALELELDTFPSSKHDDILDTLADAFQNKKYFGRMTETAYNRDEFEVRFKNLQARARANFPYSLVEEPESGGEAGYHF